MHNHSGTWKELTEGAAGGLVGTLVIHSLLKASQRWAPELLPPLRDEPGHFMVSSVEQRMPAHLREALPAAVETGAAQFLGMFYGIFFGAIYPLFRPRTGNSLVDGAVLGISVWALGYLGWLRVFGLMPPLARQRPPQVLSPVVEHVVYGIATTAAYNWLRRHF
jgi:hypothetical protein